jgi:hypothetical protein
VLVSPLDQASGNERERNLMTTNETITPMKAIESSAPRRSRAHKMITISAAMIVAFAAASALFMRLDTTESPAVRTPGVNVTLDQMLHDLAVRGIWPRQEREPAPRTMDEKLQDLVDKGLIPPPALEPTG